MGGYFRGGIYRRLVDLVLHADIEGVVSVTSEDYKYLRCIDCKYFGQHGAYCDLQDKQVLCSSRSCVFCQTRERLRKMSLAYFFPYDKNDNDELTRRGMEIRGCDGKE